MGKHREYAKLKCRKKELCGKGDWKRQRRNGIKGTRLWLYKGRGDENTAASDTDSEPVAGHSNSIREEGDESLLGDISDMSEAEREICANYLRIQRKHRPK